MTNDEEIAKKINSAIFPGIQGGPLMHVIAAKAVGFKYNLSSEWKAYAKQVVDNAQVLAKVLMQRNSTIGELMERKRIQDGAKEYQGHTYMDLARFDDATKHMIIFDVLTDESPVGWKGERNRLYLSDVGYQKALDNQKAGNIKIISHAAVAKGNLYYDHRDMAR